MLDVKRDVSDAAIVEGLLQLNPISAAIEAIQSEASAALAADMTKLAASVAIPVSVFGFELPKAFRSCRLSVMRGGTSYHVERHPNADQYVFSLNGMGSISIFNDGKWAKNELKSTSNASPFGPLASCAGQYMASTGSRR